MSIRKKISLRALGAFGLKIDRKYGGLGFDHREYVEVMQLLGSYCGNTTALLSAHQSIGVPLTVELFGSPELKAKYLPRCAAGAISAFALTEPAVGSDPARLATTARKSDDGRSFILDGKKLWCTNGTLAEIIIVMARDPATDRINCFVVDMDLDGVRSSSVALHWCSRAPARRALDNARFRSRTWSAQRRGPADARRRSTPALEPAVRPRGRCEDGARGLPPLVLARSSVARDRKHEAIAPSSRIGRTTMHGYARQASARLADTKSRDSARGGRGQRCEQHTRLGLTDTALQIAAAALRERPPAALGEQTSASSGMLRDSRITAS